VLKGQIDINAWIIRRCEQLGWAYDVKWPDRSRLERKRAAAR
jgi:stearoyl-CoA desaturase (delta-9 desaturase)